MKFIDLFAGLGGFHIALKRLGHTCVFACEKEDHLRELYATNFGLVPAGDIRSVNIENIPKHDILCAGFPCQPFSKAGDQEGFACPENGDLFDYVVRIVSRHKPKYLLLENVPNLKWHNDGDSLDHLQRRLRGMGYKISHERLSPHNFGIPQIRERIFIVGSLKRLARFKWPQVTKKAPSLRAILTDRPKAARSLSAQVKRCLKAWQRFIKAMPSKVELPPSPIWSMEFGATYPYRDSTPHKVGVTGLRTFRGACGVDLRKIKASDRMAKLPSYARRPQKKFPRWKIRFIEQNRTFYEENRKWIDPWLPRIRQFPPSLQKLEWNCKGDDRNIWKYVIQFRASGVRVKRATTTPSLIAMTTTQVPIIGWQRRYMTARECARLQSIPNSLKLPSTDEKAFAALGNAVNAGVVEIVAKSLLGRRKPSKRVRPTKTATKANTRLRRAASFRRKEHLRAA